MGYPSPEIQSDSTILDYKKDPMGDATRSAAVLPSSATEICRYVGDLGEGDMGAIRG